MRIEEKNGLVVELCEEGTSRNIPAAIWKGLHTCVAEYDSTLTGDDVPDLEKAIIHHALKFGHWSVLNQAFISFQAYGFPHDSVMQLRTHGTSGSHMLVESMRYTSKKFIAVADEKLNWKDVFYFSASRSAESELFIWSCREYARRVEAGMKPEEARRILPAGYRQNFRYSATIRAYFHMLDNRLLADTQDEARLFAKMTFNIFSRLCPTLAKYYEETRLGKNKLAP